MLPFIFLLYILPKIRWCTRISKWAPIRLFFIPRQLDPDTIMHLSEKFCGVAKERTKNTIFFKSCLSDITDSFSSYRRSTDSTSALNVRLR